MQEDIILFLSILIAGFSALVFILSIASYYRVRAVKLFIVSLAFLGFFIKGILLLLEIIDQSVLALTIDFVILLMLYFAVVKR